MKFLRPKSALISSYLTPEGPKRFGHTICDVYDQSLNEIILLNGCYWLAVRDLKEWKLFTFALAFMEV